MFRSSTIIRELAQNLGYSYIYIKTFGEITSLFITRLCGSMLQHNRTSTEGWVGPRAGLDRCGKSRPPPGFDPRTVRPVASRYTY